MPSRKIVEYKLEDLNRATDSFNVACMIGSGGFGSVYRAMLNRRPVALKVLDWKSLQVYSNFGSCCC